MVNISSLKRQERTEGEPGRAGNQPSRKSVGSPILWEEWKEEGVGQTVGSAGFTADFIIKINLQSTIQMNLN